MLRIVKAILANARNSIKVVVVDFTADFLPALEHRPENLLLLLHNVEGGRISVRSHQRDRNSRLGYTHVQEANIGYDRQEDDPNYFFFGD